MTATSAPLKNLRTWKLFIDVVENRLCGDAVSLALKLSSMAVFLGRFKAPQYSRESLQLTNVTQAREPLSSGNNKKGKKVIGKEKELKEKKPVSQGMKNTDLKS